MMISNVKDSFSGLSGRLIVNTADETLSSIEASVDIDKLDTGDGKRDAHLKSADFFHQEQHPKMTFKSTMVEKKGR
ncbi:polyisoprenoid-binding protein YceI [Silvibacterium bohemicum]|uniref:Polyisoprenoid-binding protein YceI n=1 Tax=Silvibacterium bohemicum TaxID=1577686 RepID=A0A841JV81_9BACT|nr:YceI family protein [Silvibacterium bohemicum]MBB6144445.1 polyisoprenoid-binding protein YceI [Silvibacterium bohemicum]